MERKKLKIGLFGFGCVGYGLYRTLALTPSLNAEIKTVCVKNRNKTRPVSSEHFVYDAASILDDDEINVVVELIDDADAAFEIVSRALKKGKAAVSANKKMIAEHLHELLRLQRLHNTPLLYEAACCASIPVIRNLEEYFDNDLLHSVEGIINGSTNYILTKLSTERISYHEALKQAQDLGFAESDPTLDTGGHDAAYKLQLLLVHAYGLLTKPADIFRLGIDGLSPTATRYATEKDWKVKLLAKATRDDNGVVTAYVMPAFVRPADRLYNVDDVYNGLKLGSCFSDEQCFIGKGAGAFPTASAVISDISALSYDYRYEYRKLGLPGRLRNAAETEVRVLVTFSAEDFGLVKASFNHIEETYRTVSDGYIAGEIHLSDLEILCSSLTGISVVRLPGSRRPAPALEKKEEAELVI